MREYTGSSLNPVWARGAVMLAVLALTACATNGDRRQRNGAAGSATVTSRPYAQPVIPDEPAPVPQLREDAPAQYVVKRGDTLWDIASHFLREPWQWPELWYANPQVRNPHLIYPGDVLTIVWRDGRPGLELAGDHLSPRVRVLPLDGAIPSIPIGAIREFLRGPRVVSQGEIDRAPYVVEFTDEHIVAGDDTSIYVKGIPPGAPPAWTVIRIGQPYKDPETGDLIGYEVIPTAESEIEVPGAPATLQITRAYRETRIGDRLLAPEAEAFTADFFPHRPNREIDGTIISVFDGVSQIGQYQIVSINRGVESGLEPGHVLSIMQRGRIVEDPHTSGEIKLPPLYAGTLLVFKVSARLSYGLVMTAERAIHVHDRVERPAR